jgi:endonuclease YncB( thermonuclease family)
MRLWLVILLILVSTAAIAAEIQGRVVAITDGDTFTLVTLQKQPSKIWVTEIGAPESDHPRASERAVGVKAAVPPSTNGSFPP